MSVKKGVSNLVAGVLATAITIVVSFTVASFVLSSSSSLSKNISLQDQTSLGCDYFNFFIKEAYFDANGDCTEGVNHSINITMKNTGMTKVRVSNMVLESSNGKTLNYYIGQNISPGETRTFSSVSQESCVGFINQETTGFQNLVARIYAGSDSCPGTDRIGKEFIMFSGVNQSTSKPGKYLMGLWHFDNSLSDSSGYENNGYISGGAPSYSNGRSASFGDAIYFDGTSMVIVSNPASMKSNDEITIEAWVKSQNNDTYIVAKGYAINETCQ